MNIEEILTDITASSPGTMDDLIPPYMLTVDDDQKYKLTVKALRRSISLHNRMLAIINAYFLGKFLSELDVEQERRYKKRLTNHYNTIAKYTYDLFEQHPLQIFATHTLDVQAIRKLKRSQVLYLRQKLLEFFVGTQNLGGESCHGENPTAG